MAYQPVPANLVFMLKNHSLLISSPVDFLSGKNKPFPLSVNVQDCEIPPCVVYKGLYAVMEVHFLGSKLKVLYP